MFFRKPLANRLSRSLSLFGILALAWPAALAHF